MADDNVIRLPIELDDDQAQRDAKKFIDQLEQEFKKAQRALANALAAGTNDPKSTENIKRLTREVNKAERELKNFQKTVDRTGVNSQKANNSLGKLAGGFSKISSLSKGLGLLAVGSQFLELGRSVQRFVFDSLEAFSEFEKGFAEVKTLLADDLSDQQFAQLEDQVKAFSVEAGRTTEDVLPALYQAISAGVPTDNVFGFLETANEAAIAGVSTLETSVGVLAGVVNAFGSDVITAQEVSDTLFVTVREGVTTFGELAPVIARITPIASDLGLGFSDVGASIAALTASGAPTAQAVTQIRSALTALSTPTTVIAEQFEVFTGKTVRDFINEGGNLADIFEIVGQISSETGLELSELFGRVEAATAAAVFTGTGAEKLTQVLAEMENGAGATSLAMEQLEGTGDRLEQRFEASAKALRITIGEQLDVLKTQFLELGIAVTTGINTFITASERLDNQIGQALSGVDDVEERAKRLVSAFQLSNTFVGEVANLDEPVEEEIRALVDEIIVGAKDAEDAVAQLESAFGEFARVTEFSDGRTFGLQGEDFDQIFVTSDLDNYIRSLRSADEAQEQVAGSTEQFNEQLSRQQSLLTAQAQETERARREAEAYNQTYELSEEQIRETQARLNEFAVQQRETTVEVIRGSKALDDTNKAAIDLAIEAGASADRIRELAIETGAVTERQFEAREELNQLSISFRDGKISASEFAARVPELRSEIAGIGEDAGLSRAEVEALNRSLNQAVTASSGRIRDLLNRPAGGGGQSADDRRREIAEQRDEDILEIRRETAEEVAEIERETAEEIAEINQELSEEIAEINQEREDELLESRLENIKEIEEAEREAAKEIAEINKQFDEERQNRLREFAVEQAQSFVNNLTQAQSEDGITAPEAEDQAQSIIEDAAGQGASVGAISEGALDTGIATGEQIAQAAAETLRQQGQAAIAEALASGALSPENLSEAIASLNEQIATGASEIDLSEFGVRIQTAADIELEIAREREQEIRRIKLETAEEVTEINRKSAEEQAKIAEDANKKISDAQEESAKRISEISEESARDISKAFEDAARDTEKAFEKAAEAISKVTERGSGSNRSLAQQQAILNSERTRELATLAETLEARQALIEESVRELEAVGLLSEAEANREIQLSEFQLVLQDLIAREGELNQALFDTETQQTNLKQANDLIKTGFFESAEQAKLFAGILTEQQVPAFIAAFEKGGSLRDVLGDIGVNIGELPEEVQIAIESNADDTIERLDGVKKAVEEIPEEKTVTITVEEEDRRTTQQNNQARAGGGGEAEFMGGGYTGNVPPNQIAGTVHGQELVIPAPVLRRGNPAELLGFTADNVPFLDSNDFSNFGVGSLNTIAVPNSTVNNFNNSITRGDTNVNNMSGDTNVNLFGLQAERAVMGVVNTEFRRNQNRIIPREGGLN